MLLNKVIMPISVNYSSYHFASGSYVINCFCVNITFPTFMCRYRVIFVMPCVNYLILGGS